MNTPSLTPNQLALMALANEYCAVLENMATGAYTAPDDEPEPARAVAKAMVRLLPRIYICLNDVPRDDDPFDNTELTPALDEATYDRLRTGLESLLGEHDTYLEVFHEDMKYSDTPITASVAEGLADMFQTLYDFLETVRDAPDEITTGAISALRQAFGQYMSQTLCNTLRAVNSIIND